MNLDLELAKEAYVKPSKRRKEIDGYEYIDDISPEDKAVYKKGNKIKVGYRGSATPRDWLSNFEYLALGREKIDPDSIKDTIHFSKLKDEFPKADISVSGHSRGSSRADAISRQYKVPTVGFNPASTPMDILKPVNPQKTIVRSVLDPVSLFSKNLPGVKNVVGPTDLVKAHALDQFEGSPLFIK